MHYLHREAVSMHYLYREARYVPCHQLMQWVPVYRVLSQQPSAHHNPLDQRVICKAAQGDLPPHAIAVCCRGLAAQ
jgi:hypothetical protein